MAATQTEGKITALYERLSRDDDIVGDSSSIANQKTYLEAYAAQQGFTNCVHYTDDGYSGVNFDRPGWNRMIDDMEAGKIGIVLVKDMSRIGRNYLSTGFYTEEVFRKFGVRFIAVSNGIDSNDPSTNEFMTASILRQLVLDAIRHVSIYAIANQEEFLNKVHAASQLRQEETSKQTKRQMNRDRKRIDELDNIIKKLYESYAIGRITDERFDSLLAEYEAEQKDLKEAVAASEQNLAVFAENSARADSFLEVAKRYTDFSELTTQMLNEFIDKIIIHKPEKIDGDRVVEVDIYFRFIGNFELPPRELTPEEIKREAQLHRHRVKSRERYQKIKAGEHAVGQSFQITCKCCGKTFGAKPPPRCSVAAIAGQNITGRKPRRKEAGRLPAAAVARPSRQPEAT